MVDSTATDDMTLSSLFEEAIQGPLLRFEDYMASHGLGDPTYEAMDKAATVIRETPSGSDKVGDYFDFAEMAHNFVSRGFTSSAVLEDFARKRWDHIQEVPGASEAEQEQAIEEYDRFKEAFLGEVGQEKFEELVREYARMVHDEELPDMPSSERVAWMVWETFRLNGVPSPSRENNEVFEPEEVAALATGAAEAAVAEALGLPVEEVRSEVIDTESMTERMTRQIGDYFGQRPDEDETPWFAP